MAGEGVHITLLLLTMLFLVGYRWARATHSNPWIVGSIMLLGG
jgi:hypothetical protein